MLIDRGAGCNSGGLTKMSSVDTWRSPVYVCPGKAGCSVSRLALPACHARHAQIKCTCIYSYCLRSHNARIRQMFFLCSLMDFVFIVYAAHMVIFARFKFLGGGQIREFKNLAKIIILVTLFSSKLITREF